MNTHRLAFLRMSSACLCSGSSGSRVDGFQGIAFLPQSTGHFHLTFVALLSCQSSIWLPVCKRYSLFPLLPVNISSGFFGNTLSRSVYLNKDLKNLFTFEVIEHFESKISVFNTSLDILIIRSLSVFSFPSSIISSDMPCLWVQVFCV